MKESSLIHLIPTLWQHKKTIIVSTLLAGIVMSGVMLLLPNYYKSTALFYPVHSALLDASSGENTSTNFFGDDRDVDRLLSIATSMDLKQSLIDRHHLADHYDIDTSRVKGKIQLIKVLSKNLHVHKTQYDAIQLSVEDKDPIMAQTLTQQAQQYINDMTINVIQQSQRRIYDQLVAQRTTLDERLKIVTDSLSDVRSMYGIYGTESQAEALTTLEINFPKNKNIEQKIKDYNKGISTVISLGSLVSQLNREITTVSLKEQQIASSLEADLSALHVIEEASLPLEKSRPSRSLYVLASMLGIGLFASALILMREQLRSAL